MLVSSFLEDPAGWVSTIIAGASLAWNVLQQFQIHSIRHRDDLAKTDLKPFLDSTSNSIVYFRLVGPLTMYDVRIPPSGNVRNKPLYAVVGQAVETEPDLPYRIHRQECSAAASR